MVTSSAFPTGADREKRSSPWTRQDAASTDASAFSTSGIRFPLHRDAASAYRGVDRASGGPQLYSGSDGIPRWRSLDATWRDRKDPRRALSASTSAGQPTGHDAPHPSAARLRWLVRETASNDQSDSSSPDSPSLESSSPDRSFSPSSSASDSRSSPLSASDSRSSPLSASDSRSSPLSSRSSP